MKIILPLHWFIILLLFKFKTLYYFLCKDIAMQQDLKYLCVFVCVHLCHSMQMEVRGQVVELCSLLTPCGTKGSNSGGQSRQHAPLPAELAHQPAQQDVKFIT